MKTRVALLPSLVLVLAAGGYAARNMAAQTTQAEPADLETQLAEYVEVQEALAADNFESAKTQLEEFARVTDSATQALALRALEAGDIEAMRASFKPLSESLAASYLPPVRRDAVGRCRCRGSGAPRFVRFPGLATQNGSRPTSRRRS